jgi:hypothetical protein
MQPTMLVLVTGRLEQSCFGSPKKAWEVHLQVKAMLLVFFDHPGIVHYEFVPEGQTINQDLIWQFWDVCGMWYKESHLKCGLQEADSSSTQHCLLDTSWQNIQVLHFHNPLVHLTFPLLTFFNFLNSKLPLKEEDFRQWETSSLTWWMTWWSHKHPSNSASKCGKSDDIGALLRKGTILKGIIFNKL